MPVNRAAEANGLGSRRPEGARVAAPRRYGGVRGDGVAVRGGLVELPGRVLVPPDGRGRLRPRRRRRDRCLS